MKDISQPKYLAMSGIDSGAASAPTEEPALKITPAELPNETVDEIPAESIDDTNEEETTNE